ncbi:hypothetical protein Naga_100043g17 [Nannochloropsis gaditana]|uniref:Uncharacterized protein n=1 Tax=Nannochloropsis gaditana TaxID=72520 RepID=W7T823_9STRA|nr:hypothetical protein Naga_100043g17 [Nannochloropsis gaditana]
MEQASSSLGYLRMITPKRWKSLHTGDSDAMGGAKSAGRTYIVYKDGGGSVSREPLPREKSAYSNWDGSSMDPDAVRRHQHQLRRMGFRDNTHAKGGIF